MLWLEARSKPYQQQNEDMLQCMWQLTAFTLCNDDRVYVILQMACYSGSGQILSILLEGGASTSIQVSPQYTTGGWGKRQYAGESIHLL